MLTRKPRRGDVIETMTNWDERCNNPEATPEWKPVGVVTYCDSQICHYKPFCADVPGPDDLFIWQFHDGLNEAHRIASHVSSV